jgi:hypothetical protein
MLKKNLKQNSIITLTLNVEELSQILLACRHAIINDAENKLNYDFLFSAMEKIWEEVGMYDQRNN